MAEAEHGGRSQKELLAEAEHGGRSQKELLAEADMGEAKLSAAAGAKYRVWMCVVCGFMYDEAKGLPDEGIPPGTRWEDVPANWQCPECGARKEDFEMISLGG